MQSNASAAGAQLQRLVAVTASFQTRRVNTVSPSPCSFVSDSVDRVSVKTRGDNREHVVPVAQVRLHITCRVCVHTSSEFEGRHDGAMIKRKSRHIDELQPLECFPVARRVRRRRSVSERHFCRCDISSVYIFVLSEIVDARESRIDGLLSVEFAESALVTCEPRVHLARG